MNKDQEKTSRGGRTYRRRPLTSYYRSDVRPSRSPFQGKAAPGRGRLIIFNILDACLLLFILALLAYSLMLQPNPVIKASRSGYRSEPAYSAEIAPLLKGFKNSNKLSFDEAGAVAAIKKRLPEVQSAQIELPFFSPRPVVWLNISSPAFYLKSYADIYLVDQQGVAVAKASAFPAVKGLLTITDQTGFRVQAGTQALSSQNVAVISSVISQARAARVPLSTLDLPPAAEELDLRTADQPYFVKFNLAGDGLVQAGQFLAARHQFAKSGQKPAEYLDVRVPGKIFFK